jgi:3-phenylpropionate/trans-cinnamate dioxygenase ferredoxin subunit
MPKVCLGPADLAEGEMRGYEVGKAMVMVARREGRFFAMDDWCNHAGCLLSGGRLEKKMVVCPCHEVGFELSTGKVCTKPIICDDQKSFAVEEQGGLLYLEVDGASATRRGE